MKPREILYVKPTFPKPTACQNCRREGQLAWAHRLAAWVCWGCYHGR